MMSLYFFISKYYICNICKKLYCMLLLVGIAILLCSCSNKKAVPDAERTVLILVYLMKISLLQIWMIYIHPVRI